MTKDILEILIPLVFIIVSIYVVMVSARSLRKANGSLRWQSTSGQILSPRKRTVHYANGARHGGGTYEAEVSDVNYSYTVDGTEYTGERISYGVGGAHGSSKKAHAKFPPGSTVKVYYNPSDPSEAVLEPGGQLGNLGCIVVALLFMLLILRALILNS